MALSGTHALAEFRTLVKENMQSTDAPHNRLIAVGGIHQRFAQLALWQNTIAV